MRAPKMKGAWHRRSRTSAGAQLSKERRSPALGVAVVLATAVVAGAASAAPAGAASRPSVHGRGQIPTIVGFLAAGWGRHRPALRYWKAARRALPVT